jgi:hypothetical protein
MGWGRWDTTSYALTSATRSTQTTDEIFDTDITQFRENTSPKGFNPKHIEMRESCDSDDSPESTALIFALDVTGSMGMIPDYLAREGLAPLVEGILETKPVSDPHIMFMAIGDINYDDAPLQVTQFEADNRISDQLVELYLEGGGGGNNYESYDLAWAFAAQKTSIDCFSKRGKKGYLFTIGDEEMPQAGSNEMIDKMVGLKVQGRPKAADFLKDAQNRYEVFHVIVEQGSHMSYRSARVLIDWRDLLGNRAILLDNYEHLSEVCLSVIRVNEGEDPEEVVNSWQDEALQDSVRHALFD